MLIATFNCNSIRMRLPAVLDWLAEHQPDVLALQETKCPDEKFPAAAFADAGWQVSFRGQKGYNGVATLTREPLADVQFGLGDDDGLSEPRLVLGRVGSVHVLNTYVPQGQAMDSEKFAYKIQWLRRLGLLLRERFDPKRDELVWLGDLNIAPGPEDVYDHERLWPNVCHCQELTDVLADLAKWGLVDVVRKHLPESGVFTFWDYRLPRSVQRNLGWRLDHVLATEPLARRSVEAFVDLQPRLAAKPSDHTFLAVRFDESAT